MRLLALILILIPSIASASLLYLEDERRIGWSSFQCYSYGCEGTGDAISEEPTPFADWEETRSARDILLHQESRLDETGMTAAVSASNLVACNLCAYRHYGGSSFNVTFGVTEETPFRLTGTVSDRGEVELFGDGVRLARITPEIGDLAGILLPGFAYELRAGASVGTKSLTFDYPEASFTFVVPEPGTALLLLLGLAALARHHGTG